MKTIKSSAPVTSILNPKWKYSPSADVQKTWRQFGWRPTTPSQRKKRANFKTISIDNFLKG